MSGNKCNKKFSVLNVEHEDTPEEASDILCEVNNKVQIFIKYLREKYSCKSSYVKKLDKYYQHDDIVESKNETYTENKLKGGSDKIYVCLRDSENGKLFNSNLILFIILHELTHVIDDEWNTESEHSERFWILNTRVLIEAHESGIFSDGIVDYSRNPVNYCNNVKIDNNPLFDSVLVRKAERIIWK